jgi:transposase InsO family protein
VQRRGKYPARPDRKDKERSKPTSLGRKIRIKRSSVPWRPEGVSALASTLCKSQRLLFFV